MSPPFQLQVAIALVAGALPPSLIHLVFASTSGKEKLALPVSSEGNEALLKDPFDVSTPEAFVQGAPIDEEIVWKKVRTYSQFLQSLLIDAFPLDQAVENTPGCPPFCGPLPAMRLSRLDGRVQPPGPTSLRAAHGVCPLHLDLSHLFHRQHRLTACATHHPPRGAYISCFSTPYGYYRLPFQASPRRCGFPCDR